MMKTRWQVLAGLLVTLVLSTGASANDPDASRELQAAREKPHDAAAWKAVFEKLQNGNDQYRDWAARRAVALNPDNAEIILAAAECDVRERSWEFMDQLAKLPGHEKEAAEQQERLELGLNVNALMQQTGMDGDWIRRLIDVGKHQRAQEMVERALKNAPVNKDLLALRALVLALNGNVAEAMKLQKEQDYPQILAGGYVGLADVLVGAGKSAEAIESFGGRAPADDKQRRVLAWAYHRAGKEKEARELLSGSDLSDRLILLQVLREQGAAEVDAMEKELVAGFKVQQGSWYAPNFGSNTARSLVPALAKVVAAIKVDHPENADGNYYWLGGEPKYVPLQGCSLLPRPNLAQNVASALRAIDGATDGQQLVEAYASLSAAREATGDWALAKRDMAIAAFSKDLRPGRGARSYWQACWTLVKRREDGEKLFAAKPDELLATQPMLSALRLQKGSAEWEHPPIPYDVAVEQMSKLGPGVLPAVYEAFGVNMIGEHRVELMEVIARVGNEQDVPPVLHVLQLLDDSIKEGPSHDNAELRAVMMKEKLDQEKDLNACLAKLTHEKEPAGTVEERRAFWEAWLEKKEEEWRKE